MQQKISKEIKKARAMGKIMKLAIDAVLIFFIFSVLALY